MANPKTATPVPLDGEMLELLAAAEASDRRQRERRAMWEEPPRIDPVAEILAAVCWRCGGFGCDCAITRSR